VQCVSLLTFHAAKGLEFPAVFIAGAEEGITPLDAARGADLAEERRLFYVAMTRARDALCITRCRRRAVRGILTDAAPSRFLDDLPAETRAIPGSRSRRGVQLPLF
jgi:DNA helicase II / ATP-dependent DNA helicase PcrA